MKSNSIFACVASVALVLVGAFLTHPAWAQVSADENPDAATKKADEMRALLREHEGALDKAKENVLAERARITEAEAARDPALRAKLDEAVRRGKPELSPEEAEAKRNIQARLDEARANLSEQGQARVAQIVDPPIRVAQPVTPPSTPVTPGDFEAAQPTQPERVEIAPKEMTNRVRITAAGAAEFDSRTGIAIFLDDVVVDHPSFHLECDELEVHMNQDAQAAAKDEAEGGAPAPAPVPLVPTEGGDPVVAEQQASGIDLAIAKGRLVILKKKSEDGKLQVGHCRHAIFDGATGDIEMRIWPQIQKGKELIKSTSESTIITIKQDGRMATRGGGIAVDADAKEK